MFSKLLHLLKAAFLFSRPRRSSLYHCYISCKQHILHEFPCWGCNLITLSSPESKIPRYPQAVRFTLVIQCQQDNIDGGFVIDCDWSGSSFERNDLQPCSDLSRIFGVDSQFMPSYYGNCWPSGMTETLGTLHWMAWVHSTILRHPNLTHRRAPNQSWSPRFSCSYQEPSTPDCQKWTPLQAGR